MQRSQDNIAVASYNNTLRNSSHTRNSDSNMNMDVASIKKKRQGPSTHNAEVAFLRFLAHN